MNIFNYGSHRNRAAAICLSRCHRVRARLRRDKYDNLYIRSFDKSIK